MTSAGDGVVALVVEVVREPQKIAESHITLRQSANNEFAEFTLQSLGVLLSS